MSVVVLIEPAALEAYLPELEDLAANSIEPNIFYEPWILWPSLKAFGHDRQFFLHLFLRLGLTIHMRRKRSAASSHWCGSDVIRACPYRCCDYGNIVTACFARRLSGRSMQANA